MKKTIITLIGISLAVLTTSCGVGHAYLENQNQNSTQVHLSNNNFKVLEKVSGSSNVSYVLLIGGKSQREIYAEAYGKMLESANLETSSKAIVNVLTEEHLSGFAPFYFKRTITVSAHVIEFNN